MAREARGAHPALSRRYYLFGSPLVGYGVADNFYLSAPSPLGPWTYRGLFAPAGSDTFQSQTFKGLVVPRGADAEAQHVFIGHRWGAAAPPFPAAISIWLPLEFDAGGAVRQLQWRDAWDLETGAL